MNKCNTIEVCFWNSRRRGLPGLWGTLTKGYLRFPDRDNTVSIWAQRILDTEDAKVDAENHAFESRNTLIRKFWFWRATVLTRKNDRSIKMALSRTLHAFEKASRGVGWKIELPSGEFYPLEETGEQNSIKDDLSTAVHIFFRIIDTSESTIN